MTNDEFNNWEQILNGYDDCRIEESDALNFVVDFEDRDGPYGPERVVVDIENYASETDEDHRMVAEENAFLAIKAFRKLVKLKLACFLINRRPVIIPVVYTICL